MTPPIWLDELGQRRPTFQCPRCGREAPILRPRQEHLVLLGWRLYSVVAVVSWCGDAHEFILFADAEGWWRMIPVLGEEA